MYFDVNDVRSAETVGISIFLLGKVHLNFTGIRFSKLRIVQCHFFSTIWLLEDFIVDTEQMQCYLM